MQAASVETRTVIKVCGIFRIFILMTSVLEMSNGGFCTWMPWREQCFGGQGIRFCIERRQHTEREMMSYVHDEM